MLQKKLKIPLTKQLLGPDHWYETGTEGQHWLPYKNNKSTSFFDFKFNILRYHPCLLN